MKKLLLLIIIFISLRINAQNYLISFAGSGESSNVSSVKIESLSDGTTLTLNGTDILRLIVTIPTGMNSIRDEQSPELNIYPNPMNVSSTIVIYPPAAGSATISVCEMTGKLVSQSRYYLENSRQEFSLTGLIDGLYLISVKGNSYQFSGKLLCIGESNGIIKIERVANTLEAVENRKTEPKAKGSQSVIDMEYPEGSRLKFIGISGIYSTVITDIPVSDKTITFNFIACSDGDNNYPVVEIGTQVWMAENLKTIKYGNGNFIGTTDPYNKDISEETDPKYHWAYEGNESNVATYGRLYTWYAVTDSRNVCPTGWHLPTDTEWSTLTTWLGGESVAGGKLKESGTTHWNGTNEGSTNETGFTALPAGNRHDIGIFDYVGNVGSWWSSNEFDADNAIDRIMEDDGDYADYATDMKTNGYSVRCVRD